MTSRALLTALPFIAAVLVHLPPLGLPLLRDDYHSLYQAARTWQDPALFFDPWMGGVFRALPKLYFMGAVKLFGDVPWLYRLVNLALHLFCTWRVLRLVGRAGASRHVALVAALLFGIGFGGYLRPVFQISNATMLVASAFLLVAIERAADRRYGAAAGFFVLAALSHEVVLVAPLLVPLVAATMPERPSPPVWLARAVPAALGALGAAALVPLGRVHELAVRVVEQTWFFVFPINTPERALGRLDAPAALLDPLVGITGLLARERLIAGLVLLACVALVVRRVPRTSALLAVSWLYLFLVPPAWLIITAPEAGTLWQHGWLERRYLYLPGVAVCGLTAAALVACRRARARAADAALGGLVAWIVLMNVITWDNYRRLGQTGDERARAARFGEAMEALSEDR